MVTGEALAKKGVALATGPQIFYSEYDCQGFMELIFSQCGQPMNYKGSNDMIRNACTWVGTLSEAKKLGYLKKGVALFIVDHDGGEVARGYTDGLGNASHVGMYVGANALTDISTKGTSRQCDVVHSSASMNRVAGSTLQNAWTHVGLWKNVDFGIGATNPQGGSGMTVGTGMTVDAGMTVDTGIPVEAEYAAVHTPNGGALNFRTKMNTKAALVAKMPEIPYGAKVEVNYRQGEWSHVTYEGYSGFVKSEYLAMTTTTPTQTNNETVINTTSIVTYIQQIRDLLDVIENSLE